MPNETGTPGEIVDKQIKELEGQAQDQIANIGERVSSVFWDKVQGFFGTMFQGVWKDYLEVSPSVYDSAIKMAMSWTDPFGKTNATKTIGEILERETDPDIILAALERVAEQFPIIDVTYKIVQFAITLFGILSASMTATTELASQEVLAKRKPTLLPLEYAIDAVWKDPGTYSLVENILNRVGLNSEYQKLLLISSEAILSPEDARAAYLRGIIDENKVDKVLAAHHLSGDNITTVKELYQIIPPIQDIITMAVREVFTPEIVEKFGQMEGLPPDFSEWAAKQGLSPYWTSAYWAAHWSLPSVLQGFEMMHRGVIDDDELAMLLKALDIMPYWRDRLKEISYNPLTRVDVRRMYALGVLDDIQVKKSYKDIGYNDENADLMTQFTIAFTTEKEKELSKSDILTLYKKYSIDNATAESMLQTLGYSEGNAGLLLSRADFEVYAAYKKKQIGYIQRSYVAGKISETDAVGRLGKLDLPASEVNYLLVVWDLDRESKVQQLTLANLQAFFTNKIISLAELKAELLELGYNAQDTSRFAQLFAAGEEA